MSSVVAQSSAQAIADKILREISARKELTVEPGLRSALLVPEAIVEELGLPDSQFDLVAKLYDAQVRVALAEVVIQAGSLAPA